MIMREVQIHCNLSHDNIVQLYGFYEDADKVYLLMELCEGELIQTLQDENGRLDVSTARHYFVQLVAGVTYLHKHNIVHRDLKVTPQSTLVGSGCQ